MGMSTWVVGFKPADAEWNKMLKVWESCENAGVNAPDEVLEFFNDEDPTGKPGMQVDISGACTEHCAEMEDGYNIDISKLPPGVKFVRVFNSY